ncbi:MAG: type II secretion system protein, partial [Acidimicrobiales bacterium]
MLKTERFDKAAQMFNFNDQNQGCPQLLRPANPAGPLFVDRWSLSRVAAFTLVELLVVISIISVLIALLLPALARARSLANQMACASNQRQIGVAMYEWADDNKGFAPGCGQGFGMGAGQMVPVAG